MSLSVDYRLEGFDALDKKLASLGEAVSGRFMRQAAGSAMTPVFKAARQRAPKGSRAHKTYKGRWVAPGFLSRNIKKTTFKSKGGGFVSATVSVNAEAFYGVRFVQKGIFGKTKKTPDPWLQESFDKNEGVVLNKFKQELLKRVDRAMKK